MAPVSKSVKLPGNLGFWGPPSATIDWCEDNYVVTTYVAEFWNTVTNLMMILPAIVGSYRCIAQMQEKRFMLCYFALLFVGIGSWCFHMTLHYGMQLLDELPMIWGSSIYLYALIEINKPPNSHNTVLQYGLLVYCAVVTIVYLENRNNIFFEVSYIVMVLGMLISTIRIVYTFPSSDKGLYSMAFFFFLFGCLVWTLDNKFCLQWRSLKKKFGIFSPVLEFHGWWHLFAGFATYLFIICFSHTRCIFLKKNPEIKYWLNVWPYLEVGSRRTEI